MTLTKKKRYKDLSQALRTNLLKRKQQQNKRNQEDLPLQRATLREEKAQEEVAPIPGGENV